VIDLPRGGYVPRIRRREAVRVARPAAAPAPHPAEPRACHPPTACRRCDIAPFVVIGMPDTRFFAAEFLAAPRRSIRVV